MYSFQALGINQVDLEEYYHFKDKLIFTTIEWLNYIKTNQKADPLIIRITENRRRPNEAMFWYGIRCFRDRGYVYADMNGDRTYKEKFRPE